MKRIKKTMIPRDAGEDENGRKSAGKSKEFGEGEIWRRKEGERRVARTKGEMDEKVRPNFSGISRFSNI
jgi:hypothetical protein